MKELSFKQRLTTHNKLAEFVKEEDGKGGAKSVLVLGAVIGTTLLGSVLLDVFPPSDAQVHSDHTHYDQTDHTDNSYHGDS